MKKHKILLRIIIIILTILLFHIAFIIILPTYRYFYIPKYDKVDLTAFLDKTSFTEYEYETIFEQTGLGKSSVNYLILSGNISDILYYQDKFFQERKPKNEYVVNAITFMTQMQNKDGEMVYAPPFVEVKEGDILVSLATATMGYSHGHAAIYLGNGKILESYSIGTLSGISPADFFLSYNNYAILRPKTEEIDGKEVAAFAKKYLQGKEYSLTSGIYNKKYMTHLDNDFTLHCSFLPWYAWQEFGVNLDSDGGVIVTPKDILLSKEVEVVQMYGFSPEIFK